MVFRSLVSLVTYCLVVTCSRLLISTCIMALHFTAESVDDQMYTDFGNLSRLSDEVLCFGLTVLVKFTDGLLFF